MSEGKWTPGPWFCDDVGIIRVGAEVWKYQQPVMHASAWREGAWHNDPTAIANGRLMAAAPELYEALRRLDAFWTECHPAGPDYPMMSRGENLSAETVSIWKAARKALLKASPEKNG